MRRAFQAYVVDQLSDKLLLGEREFTGLWVLELTAENSFEWQEQTGQKSSQGAAS